MESIFIVVVLPAPLGPRKPKNCPRPTVKSIPETARVPAGVDLYQTLYIDHHFVIRQGNSLEMQLLPKLAPLIPDWHQAFRKVVTLSFWLEVYFNSAENTPLFQRRLSSTEP